MGDEKLFGNKISSPNNVQNNVLEIQVALTLTLQDVV
jgi:hypothetical protein